MEKGSYKEAENIKNIGDGAEIFYVRQRVPRGLGDAIKYAEKHVGNEPFTILLGDDIVFNKRPATKQLINIFWKYNSPVIAVEKA